MNLKRFFKIFVILFLVELVIGFGDVLAFNYDVKWFGVQIDSYTNTLVHTMSLPIGILNRDYPFYAEGFLFSMSLFIVNVIIQTSIYIFLPHLFKSFQCKSE